ncbi:MAG TPA: hypothetical protein DCG53_05775 [Syntrophus sp. (in: bacteria)]|nr:hypothetical protein [Syntrophus sp. (in: bacteria)]
MRKTICASVIVLICMSSFALADTLKVINQRNEYGGTTNEITLSPTERSYEDGVETSRFHYDSNGKILKKEDFYTNQKQRETGAANIINYYDNNGKMVKKEEFYTDQKQRETGVVNTTYYIGSNGKKVKVEEFYADQKQQKDGIEASRFYYDGTGKMVKREDFYPERRQRDINDFRCLKSIGGKTPLRLQFVFNTDKPDVGYVIYKNGSGPIAVKMIKEREVRRVKGGGPSEYEAQWEEITSDGTGGKYNVVSQGARISEFRYIRKKDGKQFKFEEDVESITEKGCKWNEK